MREGFISQPSADDTESFELKMTRKLANQLRHHGKIKTSVVRTKPWIKEFSILRKEYTKNQIRTTLNWLIAHLDDEDTPKVYSARTFRANFIRLYQRANKDPSSVVLSDVAKKLLGRYKTREWPTTCLSTLGLYIQRSLEGYEKFYQKFLGRYSWMVKHRGNESAAFKQNYSLAKWLLGEGGVFVSPNYFVDLWIQNTLTYLKTFPTYQGSMMPLVCTQTSERFRQFAVEATCKYTSNFERWKQLEDFINGKDSA